VTAVHHPPFYSLFHPLKRKRKAAILTQLRRSRQNSGRWWVASQSTIYRMHLKNDRWAGNGAYAKKETTLKAMVANRPKVSFCPDDSTSPGIYGWLSSYNFDRHIN
jgi:hypothetical protein